MLQAAITGGWLLDALGGGGGGGEGGKRAVFKKNGTKVKLKIKAESFGLLSGFYYDHLDGVCVLDGCKTES